MPTREQLEDRIAELEKQLEHVRKYGARGVRLRADFEIANLPLYEIAFGPDIGHGEVRGHARGIVAIGDVATGVIALGGVARGVVALGGLAVGVVTMGGWSIGALVAAGGLAMGAIAVGGGALGGVAIGGGAIGYYACGGAALGEHVAASNRRDEGAEEFFSARGLAACDFQHSRWRDR
ncbi:MAG TPA: hypothetical protein VFP44_25000 [Usitatibacter sp.]|nr:hypothetical protein [Usitatibacter sp.]